MNIKTNADNRKLLVKAICEYTGAEQKYLGPPTFAYRVGDFTIDRDSNIICETEKEGQQLKEHLIGLGYVEPEIDRLEISAPIEGMDGSSLRNLVFMLHSKQYLLNRVVASTNFTVSESLIESLETNPPETKEALLSICEAEGGIEGLTIDDEKVTFTFPLSENSDKNKAYAEVAALMVKQAKAAKRISPTEQTPENEKYYLRTWLVRLGLGGEGGKVSRKALLAGLKGHTAFRTPADEEKHKARLKAKKDFQHATEKQNLN
ncbi:hypothetical protein H5P36_12840 [Bacillus sp. APMAM]|nr:hypothetical protein [Bacillus sp. APMAM]RTZ55579.1 hypothetical protein EKO25_12085 [Bacillus sp. SAJ1]